MTRKHPCPYTPRILSALPGLLRARESHVHDPFAGEGSRLGAFCDEWGITFTGTEIEPSLIVDPRVAVGDATVQFDYPLDAHTIVTSPVYPNGMADHFKATDASDRNTYRQVVASIEGGDRPLHTNNMGRWGYRGRGERSKARKAYWKLAHDSVACWQVEHAIVNVKDFMVGDHVEPVVEQWADTLRYHGFVIKREVVVPTPGQRRGANHRLRLDHEIILDAWAA